MRTKLFLSVTLFTSLQINAQVMNWAIQDGGEGTDISYAISKDNNENLTICGYFEVSSEFGNYPLTSEGLKDIFIAQYDSAGNNNWAIRTGGTGDDVATGIVTDADNNLYVTGTFSGTALFDPYSLTTAGGVDIFIAKFNSSGDCLWAKRCGGNGSSDNAIGIVGESNGNIYITGMFSSTADFDTISLISDGGNDMFVAKFNSSGDVQWAVATGGSTGTVTPRSIAMEAGNAIYVCGNIQGDAIIGTDSLNGAGGYDMFMAKFAMNGIADWARISGGSGGSESANACAAEDGGAYMIGYFVGPVTFDTLSLNSTGAIFLVKYNSSGTPTFAKKFDSNGQETGTCVATDGDNILIAGKFNQSFVIGSDTLLSSGSGAFVARLDTAGNPLWAIGSSATSASSADSKGFAITGYYTVYLTGNFTGNETFGTETFETPNTAADIFLVKLSESVTVASLDEKNNPNSLVIYPNPVFNEFLIKGTTDKGELVLIDRMGKELIRQKTFTAETIINSAHLPSGIYMLIYKEGNKTANSKLMKF